MEVVFLFVENIAVVMIIGIMLSLLFTEFTGVMPAGLVVPGYLVLVCSDLTEVLTLLLISLATYIIVVFGISKITILYGKRKFTAMITVGLLIKMLMNLLVPSVGMGLVEVAAVGTVIPGLIANTIQRQGLIPTISSTVFLTLCTLILSMGAIRFF